MKGMEGYEVILLLGSVLFLVGFAWYVFTSTPLSEFKTNARRRVRNVRYFCSNHFKEGRKEKEFVIIADSKCELCKKVKESK